MTGFLFRADPHRCNALTSNKAICGQKTVKHLVVSPQVELYTWCEGQSSDIHISLLEGDSLLILQGYINDPIMLSGCSSQDDVCDRVHINVRRATSAKELESIVKSLNGSFSLLFVSLKKKKIWTVTDRLASRFLWINTINNSFCVSSHAVTLARNFNINDYSPGSVASFLLYGNQVEPTSSILEGVKCQQEGVISQYTFEGQCSETKWYEFSHSPDYSSVTDWVDRTADCFLHAAERLLAVSSHPLLFLSGGVDSRLVGAALIAAGGSTFLCTLGDSYNLEVKIATAVARAFQCPHEVILRDDEWYLRVIEKAVFSSNGMFSWNHSHFSEAYQGLQKRHGVDAAILGDLSEAFSKICFSLPDYRNQLWTEQEFVAEFDSLPLPNYRPVNRFRSLNLLTKDFRFEAEKQLDQTIRRRYRRVSRVSKDPQIVGDYFFRWQTTACIPTFQMFNDVRSVGPERNLMFDNELHKLLETMPSDIRNSKNLGSKIIYKLYPKAAWVPNANSLIPLHFPVKTHTLAKAIKPTLGKIRRTLFSNSYKTTASWPHLPLLYAGNTQWKKRIEERIFDASLLSKDVFEQQSIESYWRDFCDGDLTLHSDVERLLGLAELRRLL